MTVQLSPQTEAKIEQLVASGQYADADAVIHRALEALEQARFLKLRALVLAGHRSGKTRELTPEVWEEIAQDADESDRLGLPLRDEVQP